MASIINYYFIMNSTTIKKGIMLYNTLQLITNNYNSMNMLFKSLYYKILYSTIPDPLALPQPLFTNQTERSRGGCVILSSLAQG